MSNEENSNLIDRARDLIDVWEGTLHAKYLRESLENGNMELLRMDVKLAEDAAFEKFYQPQDEPLSDEDIEKIAKAGWTGTKLEQGDVF